MSIFDIFKPPQPERIAPHVTERPAMTEHKGKIINSACICWTVHQYILDTISNRLIYEKYHKCETEAAARALCNSLKCQHLPGGHVNLVDYWGEYSEASYQAGLTEAREKASQDFNRQLELLRAKKVEDLDKVQARYLQVKEERDNLRRQLEAILVEQATNSQQEPEPVALPAVDVEQIREEIRAEFEERVKEAITNVVSVLIEPDKNSLRAQRLAHDSLFCQWQGTTEQKLIQHYLYKIIDDD
jgi:hypothetical protein